MFFTKRFSIDVWATLLISTSAGFLLCGYEFLRSASNTLFGIAYGPQNLPVVMALMPLGVILMVYVYGWILSKVGARKTLYITSLISGIFIFGCYLAIQNGSAIATGFLYIYREAYIVLLIEQYWSFLNSTFQEQNAKKLNGFVTGIASFGAIAGGTLVHQLAESYGTQAMLIFASISVIPAALFSDFAYIKCGEPKPSLQEKEGKQGHLGIHELRTSPMLLLLFTLILVTQIVSTTFTLSFDNILFQSGLTPDQRTAYYGKIYAMMNGGAAFLQFFVAPIVLTFLPFGFVHIGMPLIHMSTAFFLISYSTLQAASVAYVVFKALDYSLFRISKEILYIPLSFDARYRAKEFIDVFGYRFSKGGTSLLFTFVQKGGIFTGSLISLYSWTSFAASVCWVALIIPILRYFPKRQSISEKLFKRK